MAYLHRISQEMEQVRVLVEGRDPCQETQHRRTRARRDALAIGVRARALSLCCGQFITGPLRIRLSLSDRQIEILLRLTTLVPSSSHSVYSHPGDIGKVAELSARSRAAGGHDVLPDELLGDLPRELLVVDGSKERDKDGFRVGIGGSFLVVREEMGVDASSGGGIELGALGLDTSEEAGEWGLHRGGKMEEKDASSALVFRIYCGPWNDDKAFVGNFRIDPPHWLWQAMQNSVCAIFA